MRVAILGGYGVFGSRLAELLLRDGHEVWIVGRSLDKAQALVARLGGGHPMATDARAAPDKIFDCNPEVVVDAAGPFRANLDDPYLIPRLCLVRAVDYLDLSDDADFTFGFAALNEKASRTGRRLLSGASSVPGISSAVAAELCRGFDQVLLIDTAILPGNRAPRGASVIASIVGRLDAISSVWRGGVWRNIPCWSDPRRVSLAPDLVRTGRFIEVPDIRLFPQFFGARSVMFRAGMELGVLNTALRCLGVLRRRWPFEVTARRTLLLQWLANLFIPFGTDRGGMHVAVVGSKGSMVHRREWRLIAEAGHGPYIPAVTARALIRRLQAIPSGARPCLAETTLAEIEAAISDLSVITTLSDKPHPPLFQSALANRWAALPPEVQTLHSVQDVESFTGTAQVTRGTSAISRLAAWVFGFPPTGENVPVTVTKTRNGTEEIWERNFNGRKLRSCCTLALAPYRYRERFGLFNYELELLVEEGCLHFLVRRGWFLGIPLPQILLPVSNSKEYVRDGVFHFDIAISAPPGGALIVHYRGQLWPDAKNPVLTIS